MLKHYRVSNGSNRIDYNKQEYDGGGVGGSYTAGLSVICYKTVHPFILKNDLVGFRWVSRDMQISERHKSAVRVLKTMVKLE